MANLLVEIGNTALKAAWSERMTLGKVYRYQGENMFGYVNALLEKEKPSVLVISSTVPVPQQEEKLLKAKCSNLLILDQNHKEISYKYGFPEYLPPDRISSILAARHLFAGKGSIIFDFGTTLTIDILEPDGEYVGGNISLGLMTRLKALNRYSRTLPLIDIPETVRQTGDSLESSVGAGAVSGIMFEIQGYAALFPEKTIVFTGGDALYFAKRMKNSIFVICNLVLMGLALIANEYVERKAY